MTAGLRERQKTERRLRIEAAARAVFREKGYEAATTREIAARAEVSIGTLFAYAADKRDLLAMVYRDELQALTERTFASLPADAAPLDRIMHVLAARYAYWSSDPVLARHAVRETFAAIYPAGGAGAEPGPEALLLTRLIALIADEQHAGALAGGDEPALIARVVLDIYLSENRAWLAEAEPDLSTGTRRLRAALELALRTLLT